MPDLALPAKVPQQAYRPAQSNIPNERSVRDWIKRLVKDHVATRNLVPPMPMAELREHAAVVRDAAGLLEIHDSYIAVLINNESWRDTLAQVPYDRRLLLLPKCLRVEEHCPAPFDEFGLLCKECGLCSIQEFTAEADRLGYAVLVAEGSAIVRSMIETGKIDAIVGVSCLNVLEKSFPHMEAAAVPGVAIPLLQDDCINCTVDLDWVWDVIHLTSEDQTYRLDLDGLKGEVKSWFTADTLDTLIGAPDDPTARIAREWMTRSGNRWRPYLATCVNVALECDGKASEPTFSDDLKRLAVAIECFHKASLIHDDIEDGDQQRYGEPTLHAEYGEPVAINVGDFLVGEGYRLISELSDDIAPETKVEMLRLAATGHVTLSRGQGRELVWARNPEPLSSKDVLKIFSEKTAPAFDVALRLGALFAGTDGEVHHALTEYSESIGIAYQIKDDIEDFTGDSDSHDLRDLRPSLLLAILGKRAKTDEQRALVDALWKKKTRYEDVQDEVDRLLRELGVVDKASELKGAYEEQAVRALRFLENATLKGLLRRVVGKIFPRTLIEGYCSEFEARNAPGGEAGASSSG